MENIVTTACCLLSENSRVILVQNENSAIAYCLPREIWRVILGFCRPRIAWPPLLLCSVSSEWHQLVCESVDVLRYKMLDDSGDITVFTRAFWAKTVLLTILSSALSRFENWILVDCMK